MPRTLQAEIALYRHELHCITERMIMFNEQCAAAAAFGCRCPAIEAELARLWAVRAGKLAGLRYCLRIQDVRA
eukprot:3429256-Rhodomonas_salina.1